VRAGGEQLSGGVKSQTADLVAVALQHLLAVATKSVPQTNGIIG
jgi:hypothetical protein